MKLQESNRHRRLLPTSLRRDLQTSLCILALDGLDELNHSAGLGEELLPVFILICDFGLSPIRGH